LSSPPPFYNLNSTIKGV